jgi:hypothetical protein
LLAPIVSAAWVGVGTAFAIETQQYGLLGLTAVITVLLASGVWIERRAAEDEPGGTDL